MKKMKEEAVWSVDRNINKIWNRIVNDIKLKEVCHRKRKFCGDDIKLVEENKEKVINMVQLCYEERQWRGNENC